MRALYSVEVKEAKGDRWYHLSSATSYREARRSARCTREFMRCYGTRIRKWARPRKKAEWERSP